MIDYEELLYIVKNEDDLEEFLTHENKYEYLYNLSSIRRNILDWFDFDEDARLLEIGAECGALTGLFCERVKEVIAIEEDEKKREINEARNEKYNNLKVLSESDIDELKKEKFDYVTIIGGFSPEKLGWAKSLIKEDGTLIVAIENKYGIKYWAGTSEDNTGVFFDSIEGYGSADNAKTFSKENLSEMIKKEGFKEIKFYYPIPDYKFPMELYSQDSLPKMGSIKSISPSYENNRYEVFDEVKAIDTICNDGKFDQFANSFLVVCK